MTMSEYLAVIKLIQDNDLQDQQLKVYTLGHEFTGYAVANPQDGVAYFSSEQPTEQSLSAPPKPKGTYTCVALESITAIELSADNNSQAETPQAPTVIDTPMLSGDPTVGSLLTCTMGNWNNEPTSYTYQFKRDGTDIAPASPTNTYTTTQDDTTHSVTCVVTATNAAGSTPAPESNAIAVA